MQRHRKLPHGAAKRGFTLIELLTVIAIIGILAAIIIPVTGSVRKRARATVAASNIRQLVNGQLAHALDNKGRFTVTNNYPKTDEGPKRVWILRLAPYVMPSVTDSAKLNAQLAAGLTVFDVPEAKRENVNDRTVAMNWVIQANVDASGNAHYTLSKIPRPATTIILGEIVDTGTETMQPHDRGRGLHGPHTPGFRRDGEKALMGFYDGRVKAMTIDELAWTGKTPENNPWWWK